MGFGGPQTGSSPGLRPNSSARGCVADGGTATAIGEQPIKGLLDPRAMARLSVGEALTNLVWACSTANVAAPELYAAVAQEAASRGQDGVVERHRIALCQTAGAVMRLVADEE